MRIIPTSKPTKPTYTARLCPNTGKAFRIVHRHWSLIQTDLPVLKKLITTAPRLAYRANHNLSKKLVRAKLRQKQNKHTTTPN